MSLITAFVIMFSNMGSNAPKFEVIDMPPMYIVANMKEYSPVDNVRESIKILRKYTPTYMDME